MAKQKTKSETYLAWIFQKQYGKTACEFQLIAADYDEALEKLKLLVPKFDDVAEYNLLKVVECFDVTFIHQQQLAMQTELLTSFKELIGKISTVK